MKRSIVQTGSSLAVTLPMEVVQAFGLQKGQEVEVAVHPQTGAITIRPGVAYVDGGADHGPIPGAGRRGPRASRRPAAADAPMTRYLSVEQVLSLHQGLTGLLSGDPGIRDLRALDAAVLKPTLSSTARTSIRRSPQRRRRCCTPLVTTTPFVTASKGTAAVAAECFLAANGVALAATDQESRH